MFPDFHTVETYLNSLINYEQDFPVGGTRSRPKLDPSLHAVERLRLPLSLPRCAHIAGTVAKGSIARFTESILSSRFETLTFTSPHLESVKERITLNGKLLDDSVWCEGFSEIVAQIEKNPQIKLTYFEATWIFYLWASQHLKTHAHVVETGLGGRWDATNILENTLAIIAVIDLDHTVVLGNTPQEIAADKCGIIKPKSSVVVSPQPNDVDAVIKDAAMQQNARTYFYERAFNNEVISENQFRYSDEQGVIEPVEIPVRGNFQKQNAAVAIQAARLLAPELRDSEIKNAVKNSVPRARQQLLADTPPVLVDVAHNPASFASLADTLRRDFKDKTINAVIAMMKDKDAANSLKHLRGLVSKIYIVEADTPRTTPAEQLQRIAQDSGLKAEILDRYGAFASISNHGVEMGLVTGSFYLVGDYLKWRANARTA